MADTGGSADIVTLLFTDLVGSTELLQSLGADRGRGSAAPFAGLRLLGPLDVVCGGAAPGGSPDRTLDIGSAKQRAVLAVLGVVGLAYFIATTLEVLPIISAS